jgi:hypothetical protein
LKQLSRQQHKRVHANCISGQLIRIAKVKPQLAVIMCDEAQRLKIASLPLLEIIKRVGGTSAAQLEMKQAANGFQDNSQRSKDPSGSGVPDKTYPVSSYPDKQACISGLINDLNVDPSRAEEECSSQFGSGSGTKGSSWYTSASPKGNPVPATVHVGSGNMIAVRGAAISKEIREQYGKELQNVMNASVSPTNEVEVPAWAYGFHSEPPNLRNAISNTNLKGASLDKHIEYMESIHEPIATTLRNRAERHSDKSRQRIKSSSYEGKPYWAIACNI